MHKILIVGGGFGGIKAAQELSKKRFSDVSIRLVDPKSYMEYHAAVYRLVTGRSTTEVCIPYADLLVGTNVELVRDAIIDIDAAGKVAKGKSGSQYNFDTLILATGSETSYFGIQGIAENAQGIKTVEEALELKTRLHDAFEEVKNSTAEDKNLSLRFVVIGGGASGVELAGELAWYGRKLAKCHSVDPSLISVDLIEAMPRILSTLPEAISQHAEKRLRSLGVNVHVNRSVVKEDVEQVYLKDMQMKSKTIIWTAGMKANALATAIKGLETDKRGRVIVDAMLRVPAHQHVYVIGDAASTKFSGMAQTALSDGAFAAKAIVATLKKKNIPHYHQPAPAYAVPVGPKWAAVLYHGMRFYGLIGWFLRRAADFRAFLALLPLSAAIRAFWGGETSLEVCEVCARRKSV